MRDAAADLDLLEEHRPDEMAGIRRTIIQFWALLTASAAGCAVMLGYGLSSTGHNATHLGLALFHGALVAICANTLKQTGDALGEMVLDVEREIERRSVWTRSQ